MEWTVLPWCLLTHQLIYLSFFLFCFQLEVSSTEQAARLAQHLQRWDGAPCLFALQVCDADTAKAKCRSAWRAKACTRIPGGWFIFPNPNVTLLALFLKQELVTRHLLALKSVPIPALNLYRTVPQRRGDGCVICMLLRRVALLLTPGEFCWPDLKRTYSSSQHFSVVKLLFSEQLYSSYDGPKLSSQSYKCWCFLQQPWQTLKGYICKSAWVVRSVSSSCICCLFCCSDTGNRRATIVKSSAELYFRFDVWGVISRFGKLCLPHLTP